MTGVARAGNAAIRNGSARLILIGLNGICIGNRLKLSGVGFGCAPSMVGLVAAVFVFVAGNRIARIGRVIAVVVDLDEIDMAINKRDYAFGIAVKWRIGVAGLASVPG